MKTLQKFIIISIVWISIASCTNIKNYKENILKDDATSQKENSSPVKSKVELVPTEEENIKYHDINYLSEKIVIYNDSLLDEIVLKKIKAYYFEVYNNEWKILSEECETCVKLPVMESKNDSIFYLGFKYKEDESEDPIVVGMIHCYIPTKQGINLYMSSPILYTDLNNDGTNDLIVVVHTEGGWRGGNTYNQDVFVFLKEKGSYKLASVAGDWEMVIDGEYGYIRVKNVENGILIAEGSVYTERDARCCPSDRYLMKYNYEQNKFVILSSEYLGIKY